MAKDEDRCWPGYEPVPGKRPHEQGSCRKTARSKLTKTGKRVRAARKQQIDRWQEEHPHTRRSASQGLSAPKSKPKKKRAAAPKKKRRAAPNRGSAKRASAGNRKRASAGTRKRASAGNRKRASASGRRPKKTAGAKPRAGRRPRAT